MLIYTIIGIIHLVLFIIAAIEILSANKPVANKLVWLLIIFLLPVIGLILCFLIGRGAKL